MCFFQGRGDRENRLLIIIPQVYLLSCLCDSVSLHSPPLPFMSVLWLGPCSWAVCLLPSLPGRKKEKKKKVIFLMAFDYFHCLSTVVHTMASLSMLVCNCSFMTLELHAECRFAACSRTSSSFLQALSFPKCLTCFPEML